MAREYSPEIRRLARELYCLDALSLAQTALLAGVSVACLRSWVKKEGWQAERERVALVEAEIRQNLLRARALALSKLLDWDGDKETALALNAVDKLEKIALAARKQRSSKVASSHAAKKEEQEKEGLAPEGAILPEGLGEDERKAFLEEGVNRQIAYLLLQPVANFSKRVREIKAGLDVLGAIKGREDRPAIKVSFDEG